MWRGNCTGCGQQKKLGWSQHTEFWCQACHDRFDDDDAPMPPPAPPRWEGGAWGEPPPREVIQEYADKCVLSASSCTVGGITVEVYSDPCCALFHGVGANIWVAAQVVADYLHRAGVKASNAVEIGAGCGVPGLHYAKANPTSTVHLTDVPHLLPLLEFNARDTPNAKVLPLTWGNMADMAGIPQPVDLIFASDVAFDPDYYDDLLNTIRYLSTPNPACRIVLGVAMREPDAQELFQYAQKHGMEMWLTHDVPPGEYSSRVCVFECRFDRARSSTASTCAGSPSSTYSYSAPVPPTFL